MYVGVVIRRGEKMKIIDEIIEQLEESMKNPLSCNNGRFDRCPYIGQGNMTCYMCVIESNIDMVKKIGEKYADISEALESKDKN